MGVSVLCHASYGPDISAQSETYNTLLILQRGNYILQQYKKETTEVGRNWIPEQSDTVNIHEITDNVV